jgi:hypothetical protein
MSGQHQAPSLLLFHVAIEFAFQAVPKLPREGTLNFSPAKRAGDKPTYSSAFQPVIGTVELARSRCRTDAQCIHSVAAGLAATVPELPAIDGGIAHGQMRRIDQDSGGKTELLGRNSRKEFPLPDDKTYLLKRPGVCDSTGARRAVPVLRFAT